jgi:serine/threonine protein kinase
LEANEQWAPGRLVLDYYVERAIDGTLLTLRAWGPRENVVIEVFPSHAFEKPGVAEWFDAHVARLRGLQSFRGAVVNRGDRALLWAERRGESLLRGEPMPRERALAIACDVAKSLSELHSLDIVHGALRPDTVLVDGESRVTLVDIGLDQFARLFAAMWNPRYEAPEQIEHRRSCKATDVRALALLAHELLEGRRLIEADSMQQLYRRILVEGPAVVALPHRPLFERWLRACLQLDPASRPQEPLEAVKDLVQALELDDARAHPR